MSGITTRFAPSPNGLLHLGHAYSAIYAHDLARERNGRFLLRIEDLDGARSRPELADAFREDLAWLGLTWQDVAPQSARHLAYAAAATTLRRAGLLYPCRCTRAQVAATAERIGPDGPVYAGTCRKAPFEPGGPIAYRLDVGAALRHTGPLTWTDEIAGLQQAQPELAGDVVLVRKDPSTPASYHLAATLDDATDGVTLVTRGLDLFRATHVHRLLQELLGLPVHTWHHHPLLLGPDGRKLAKSRNSPSLAKLRSAGENGSALADRLRMGESPVE